MPVPIRALILDDDPDQTAVVCELRKAGFEPDWLCVATEASYMGRIDEGWDVILADLSLVGFNALHALGHLKDRGLEIPLVVVTDSVGEEVAVDCIKQGAADYLLKGRLARLGPAVMLALENGKLEDAKRQAEIALQRSQAQYRATLNSMSEAIHVVDEDLRIVLLSKAFQVWNEQLGLEVDVLGKTIFDVFPFLPQGTEVEYQRVFATGQILVSEETVQLAGRELTTKVRRIPVYEDDRVTQVITVVRDITERRRVEEERERLLAAEREQRLQAETLREVAAALNAKLDPQQVLPLILEQLARVVQYDSASIMLFTGKVLDLVAYRSTDADRRPSAPLHIEALPHVQGILVGRKPAIISDTAAEPSWQHIPGSTQIRCWMGVPLVVQDEVIGLLNLNHQKPGFYSQHDGKLAIAFANQSATAIRNARLFDDLQRSHTELMLERALLAQRVAKRTSDLSSANAELARAARLKDEFLASMSHELRAPLNAILGFAQVLQDEVYGPINERQSRSVGNIEKSGRHLLALINDILDVSKIEAGKVELIKAPTSIESVCRASLQLTKQAAHEKQIEVSFSFDKARIGPPGPETIQADERRLKQMLVNLLSNAIKFTPQGGSIGLEVAVESAREAVRFCVWDTGIGIAEKDMKRLFQPFVQLDSSLSRAYAGTGLGLSLVHRLATMHGGSVSVESKIGEGSRFTIAIPWSGVEGERISKGSVEAQAVPAAASSSHPVATVLVADDHKETITIASESLRAGGYRVIVARNGTEAAQQTREEGPVAIVANLALPGLDGAQGIQRLEAISQELDPPSSTAIPIIVTTTLGLPGDRERYLEAGAAEYLHKPIGPRMLLKMLSRHASGNQSTGD